MATYKSIIAYDGTRFHGFQRQPEGIRTVQGELEEALKNLGWQEGHVKAAGRTDAGVHARGQVISYSLEWRATCADLSNALNAHLPSDIAAWDTEQVSPDFHPRFSARRRRYTYTLLIAERRDPLRERYAWRVWPSPSPEVLHRAAELVKGKRDFAPFGRPPIEDGQTVREIYEAGWEIGEAKWVLSLEANAFLYHMVRRLTAAMVNVAQGRSDWQKFAALFEDAALRWQGAIAPPNGLCLEGVSY